MGLPVPCLLGLGWREMATSMPSFSDRVAVPGGHRSLAQTVLACVLSLAVHALVLGLLAYGIAPGERAAPSWLEVELVSIAPQSSDATPVPAALVAAPSAPPAAPRRKATPAPSAEATVPRVAKSAPGERLTEAHAAPLPRSEAPMEGVEPIPRKRPAVATVEAASADASRQNAESAQSRQQVHEWRVQDWLSRFRKYPRAARRAGYEGTVWVRFVLDRRGTLLVSELIESSGHRLLDRAALELLDRAEPFPSLPRDTGLDRIELVLPVDYRLARSDRG